MLISTSSIVGRCLALKYAFYLAELPAHFLNHRLGCTANGSHGESAEQEGGHCAEECSYEHFRIDEVHLEEVDEVDGRGFRWVEELSGSIKILLAILRCTYHRYLYLLYIRCQ